MVLGNICREVAEADAAAPSAASSEFLEPGGGALVGLATASMAISLAVRDPPPGLKKKAYFIALTGAFFAGVAGVIAATCIANTKNPHARRAAGRKLMYAPAAPLAVAVLLSAASLLW